MSIQLIRIHCAWENDFSRRLIYFPSDEGAWDRNDWEQLDSVTFTMYSTRPIDLLHPSPVPTPLTRLSSVNPHDQHVSPAKKSDGGECAAARRHGAPPPP